MDSSGVNAGEGASGCAQDTGGEEVAQGRGDSRGASASRAAVRTLSGHGVCHLDCMESTRTRAGTFEQAVAQRAGRHRSMKLNVVRGENGISLIVISGRNAAVAYRPDAAWIERFKENLDSGVFG